MIKTNFLCEISIIFSVLDLKLYQHKSVKHYNLKGKIQNPNFLFHLALILDVDEETHGLLIIFSKNRRIVVKFFSLKFDFSNV